MFSRWACTVFALMRRRRAISATVSPRPNISKISSSRSDRFSGIAAFWGEGA
jgi:hypothetical protein